MKPVCLVLSGGGARGFAHIGVLRALEEMNIPIGKIIGSSMGAVVGGLYAVTQSADEIDRAAFEFCNSLPHFLDLRKGIKLKNPGLSTFFNKIYRGGNHKNTKIPFGVVAAEFDTAQPVMLEEGNLVDTVMASISVPFMNTPYELNGKLYFDAGLTCNFPLDFYDRSFGPLMAVNVGAFGLTNRLSKQSIFEKIARKDDINFLVDACLNVSRANEEEQKRSMRKYGAIIDLTEQLEYYTSLDFEHFQEIIAVGYRETLHQRERITARIA
jgi:NTE family protein